MSAPAETPVSHPTEAADQALPPRHRIQLIEELYERYAAAGSFRRSRFWRKKYAWIVVVGGARAAKRVVDIVLSLVGLILLSPVFLGVALMIKLTDRGPVLFWQTRVGRWGREFPFPKLRSMVPNAEQLLDDLLKNNDHYQRINSHLTAFLEPRNNCTTVEELHRFLADDLQVQVDIDRLRLYFEPDRKHVQPAKLVKFLTLTFKMKRDPRVTWIGRIIRKLSIDELPQLWCVLKGDMSLVGPRPPVPREVEEYSLADRRRLDVKPGLTCFWQVQGRGNIPFPQQCRLDVEYIESQSLWLDIKLLLQTVPAVLLGRGAY